MFKKLMVAVFILIAVAAKAEDGQKIKSKVQKVIVFLRGAQVTRTATVSVPAGTSDLVFTGISPGIDVQSIQVHANGEFTIMAVKNTMNYLGDAEKSKKTEQLWAQQKLIRDKIAIQNSMMQIYQNEENILAKNQLVKADNAPLDVLKLKQVLDFQTERTTALKIKEQAITNTVAALNLELQNCTSQIDELNQGRSQPTTNVVVTVSSKANLQSAFTISYLTNNASWYPSYDISARNINSPLNILYKANVSQKTGEEWNNVKLTLSTTSPNSNNIKPELDPYYVNFALSQNRREAYSSANLSEVVVADYMTDKQSGLAVDGTQPVNVAMAENQTSVEFNIENPYSVTNDGKPCQVEINQVSAKATYQYYVAPKINTDVFLTAQLTDLDQYHFLSGEANLYFEGTYIGKTVIDTHSVSDTLNLSLGIDKGIVVTRTLQKGFTEKAVLSSNIKESRRWLITAKNHKSQKVNLLVEDQVPVSQNALIDVEVQETTGVKADEVTGKVSWNFLLNSQGDKKIQLAYTVKYPKNHPPVLIQ